MEATNKAQRNFINFADTLQYYKKPPNAQIFTHTNILKPNLSLYVKDDEQENFYNAYCNALANNNDLGITEKHKDVSPVLIDLDFKLSLDTPDSAVDPFYEHSLGDFIENICQLLKEISDVPNDIKVYVLTKPTRIAPNKKEKKDGVHIIIPDVVTEPALQFQVRNSFIKHNPDFFSRYPFTNNIENIYDEAVISRNCWLMYGSKKDDDVKPWRLQYIYHVNVSRYIDSIKYVESLNPDDTACDLELVRLFSIRNKVKNTSCTAPPCIEQPISKEISDINGNKECHLTASEINDLVIMLNKTRADSYNEWIAVCWCLKNVLRQMSQPDEGAMFETWIEFSKMSAKYNEESCVKAWKAPFKDGLRIGTLCRWAKKDSPEDYTHFCQKTKTKKILNCLIQHNTIAELLHDYVISDFVYAGNGKWYFFDGCLWKEDKEKALLFERVRKSFVKDVEKLSNSIEKDANNIHSRKVELENERKDLKQTHEKYEEITSQLRQMSKMLEKVEPQRRHLNKLLNRIADRNFTTKMIESLGVFCRDFGFVDRLDSNPHLLAFENGVYDFHQNAFRPSSPNDMVSMNVGFSFNPTKNEEVAEHIHAYWKAVHPNEQQRNYIIKTLSRQLYGDKGGNLFHLHTGINASASNGKSTFFCVLEKCLGDYIQKFNVQHIVSKRGEKGKPMPEIDTWKGARILYCSEPAKSDKLSEDILKELTGGETIQYRMLYDNQVSKFQPMYKMHLMCNYTPDIDGDDDGIKRRIRKIDYISQFKESKHVNPEKHIYPKDEAFLNKFIYTQDYKLEFIRLLLEHFQYDFEFDMPDDIKESSNTYLEDHDPIQLFVSTYCSKVKKHFTPMKHIKSAYQQSEFFDPSKPIDKIHIIKMLDLKCHPIKTVNRCTDRNVFEGVQLVKPSFNDDDVWS